MKYAALIIALLLCLPGHGGPGIFSNQLGYFPGSPKTAFAAGGGDRFRVVDAVGGKTRFEGKAADSVFYKDGDVWVRRMDFSAFDRPGRYVIRTGGLESAPFEIGDGVYGPLGAALLKSYYFQRCSFALDGRYADRWARPAGHPDTQVAFHPSSGHTKGAIPSPGGWYDAGDYGKYVVNGSYAVALLLTAHQYVPARFADRTLAIPESGNGRSDLLDEVKVELDWLRTMQDADGGVFFKLTSKLFCGMVMPEADDYKRFIIGKATTSTLDFAAVMARASVLYRDYDAAYAADCLQRAGKAWAWAVKNPAVYFTNPTDIRTGEYGDNSTGDEFFWAAAELWLATGKEEYGERVKEDFKKYNATREPSWNYTAPLGVMALATAENALQQQARAAIQRRADKLLAQIAASPLGHPECGFRWGSNHQMLVCGNHLLMAHAFSGRKEYLDAAAGIADYILGRNVTGYCFVTGFGSRPPMHIHHRPSAADGVDDPVPGLIAGGPNSHREDAQNGATYPDPSPAGSFTDQLPSYASNEVAVNWNAAATLFFTLYDNQMQIRK